MFVDECIVSGIFNLSACSPSEMLGVSSSMPWISSGNHGSSNAKSSP